MLPPGEYWFALDVSAWDDIEVRGPRGLDGDRGTVKVQMDEAFGVAFLPVFLTRDDAERLCPGRDLFRVHVGLAELIEGALSGDDKTEVGDA